MNTHPNRLHLQPPLGESMMQQQSPELEDLAVMLYWKLREAARPAPLGRIEVRWM